MKYKIDKNRMKQINKNLVLHKIRESVEISRKDLAHKVGLTAGTITNLVNECINENLVFESGRGTSAGGRKPIFVKLNPHAGYILGIELNVNRIDCVLVDFNAEVIEFTVEVVQIEKGPEYTVNQINNIVYRLLKQNKIDSGRVLGIGLVTSGPLKRDEGVIINPPNFTGWGIVPISKMVEEKTGFKTHLEKDINGAALGEYWFCDLNRCKNLFLLCVNKIGIGSGMVIDGDIYHGGKDNAMDIGHIIVDPSGTQCGCGKKGCLEAMADGKAAVELIKKRIANGEDTLVKKYRDIDLSKIIECANDGDRVSIEIIDKCAHYLSTAVLIAIQMLNPDAIILEGEFFDGCDMLYEKVVEDIEKLPYPPFIHDIPIRRSTFREKSGAMGGVAIVLKSLQYVK